MAVVTLNDFLQNPVGSGSASVARRDIIKMNLEMRYEKISSKAKITYNAYKYKNDTFLFHFKIPSEQFYDKLYYDVVLLFTPTSEDNRRIVTLNNYMMQMFSNSPNFMYTYAYVYNQNGNLIPFLNPKISKLALTKAPTVRNPQESYGFEKSIYYALLYMKRNNLNILNRLDHLSTLKNTNIIYKAVYSCKYIQDKYNDLQKKARDEAKAKRENKKTIAQSRTTKTSSKNLKGKTTNIINKSKASVGKRKTYKTSHFERKGAKKNLSTVKRKK